MSCRLVTTVCLAVVLLLGFGVGCSSKTPIKYHRIAVQPVEQGKIPLNFGVEDFTARPELRSINLLYSRPGETGQYQTYLVTQLWGSMPSELVTEAAMEYFGPRFRVSERFQTGSYQSDVWIRGHLRRFEEERGEDGNHQAHVAFDLELFVRQMDDLASLYAPLDPNEPRIVVDVRVPIEEGGSLEDGRALTRALSRACEQAFEQIWQKIQASSERLPSQAGPLAF